MSTVTIPQPDVTTEEVSAALRKGLGPRYRVLPGARQSGPPSGASSVGSLLEVRARNNEILAPWCIK
jgi:hypothetical protein